MQTVYVKPAPPVRILFVTDLHWSVRDRTAWALFEHFRRDFNPDHIISLGDVVEFAPAGRWLDVEEAEDGTLSTTDPDELMDEIHAAGTVFARWRREHPHAQIDSVQGNHEARLARYLASTARPLLGEANLPRRWDFANLNITYTRYGRGRELPYGPHGLWITHGVKAGAHPAKTELNLWRRPGISGHVHHSSTAGMRQADGWIYWNSLPCLCRLDPAGTWAINPSWEHGFAVGFYHPDRNHLDLEIIRIQGSVLHWRDHRWEAQP